MSISCSSVKSVSNITTVRYRPMLTSERPSADPVVAVASLDASEMDDADPLKEFGAVEGYSIAVESTLPIAVGRPRGTG